MGTQYSVCQFRAGVYEGAVAGMGRHRGTWDHLHSRRAAQRHAAALRNDPERADCTFFVVAEIDALPVVKVDQV